MTVFLAIGLGYGKAREGLMNEAPRDPTQPILPNRLFSYLVFIGLVMAICTLGVIWWATDAHGEAVARTMGLTVFSLANIWFALETSDPAHSVFDMDLRANPTLLKGVGLAILVTIAAVELNVLNRLLDTTSLTIEQWIICIVVSLAVLVVGEVVKLLHISTEETTEPAAVAAAKA